MPEHTPATPERVLVLNPADLPVPGVHTRSEHQDRLLVLRPTPGCADRATLLRDVTTALGKHPFAPKPQHLAQPEWAHARACARTHRFHALVVDRAHRLTTERLTELATFASSIGAHLWALWSSYDDHTQAHHALAQTPPAAQTRLSADLPELAAPVRLDPPPLRRRPQALDRLPLTDVWRFRAACRARLSTQAFTEVDDHYQAAFTRVRLFHAQASAPHDYHRPFGAALTAWMRDVFLGPVTDPNLALVRLRAAQAALLHSRWWLDWNPHVLGQDPATHLPSQLDPRRAQRVAVHHHTGDAAAITLALHLCQSACFFDAIRLCDVTEDGGLITPTRDRIPAYRRSSTRIRLRPYGGTTYEELIALPVRIPAHGRRPLAAHRALRLEQGATDSDSFFVHASSPGWCDPDAQLRHGLQRLCRDLRINPTWTHGPDCPSHDRRGNGGWLATRALTLTHLEKARCTR
ncbi:hypothetical protein [Nocardiopsis kunsanensis]|uniref:hypothetical protein n=1 Tax=Nocardiopsis kunsanensis TaxID=141693 RepID=UPI00034ADC0B|nr:hypothetical protein [Nocardiopsis kunsanensis]